MAETDDPAQRRRIRAGRRLLRLTGWTLTLRGFFFSLIFPAVPSVELLHNNFVFKSFFA